MLYTVIEVIILLLFFARVPIPGLFCAGQYTKTNLPSTPSAVWVIETKKEGSVFKASLHADYIISGDSAKYGKHELTGSYKLPLGTLTIEETKAPAGPAITGSNALTGTEAET